MQWRKVTLVGVGLLGGSLGQAMRRRGLAKQVVGFVRREPAIEECLRVKAVDSATTSLPDAVAGADLIVLCTPIAQMGVLAAEMLPHVSAGVLVTDVGSVKGEVVNRLEPLFAQKGAEFLGSHPMAGAEKTGVLHSRAELFQDAVCVVTPSDQSSKERVDQIEALWRSVGSRVLRMSPPQHDEWVSRSSHLPHVIAAELVNQVLFPGHLPEQAALCATGFRDTTRIASGSPEMWRDIALANRENLSKAVGGFIKDLEQFQRWLQEGNQVAIQQFFAEAKKRRDTWCDQGKSPE